MFSSLPLVIISYTSFTISAYNFLNVQYFYYYCVASYFSILGVTPHCTDDDIKKYYKRQAVLVHPDKNNQPGAEEAFKILVHAFELIGEPVSVLCF
jgi:preprotein translocase subunit Sec63